MAHHLAEDGILSFSLNPGGIKSELQREFGSFSQWIANFLLFPTPMGAINQLYAGTSPDLTIRDTGKYFIPWARAHPPAKGVQDPALAEKLWKYLEEETAGKY
jgi:retinol dehydrogenase 12